MRETWFSCQSWIGPGSRTHAFDSACCSEEQKLRTVSLVSGKLGGTGEFWEAAWQAPGQQGQWGKQTDRLLWLENELGLEKQSWGGG